MIGDVLSDKHGEELLDADSYETLADEAPEKYASILRQIAREERVHARHLADILSDMGYSAENKTKEE